jgi:hypothetical protein
MQQNAAVFLKVRARDRLVPRPVGIEGRGPEHDVLPVKGAIALANRHRRLPRVIPHGGEAIRFRIKAGDSGARALGPVSLEEGEIRLQKLYCLHVPFVTIGFPFIGKNVLTTSQSPANCASSF